MRRYRVKVHLMLHLFSKGARAKMTKKLKTWHKLNALVENIPNMAQTFSFANEQNENFSGHQHFLFSSECIQSHLS